MIRGAVILIIALAYHDSLPQAVVIVLIVIGVTMLFG